MIEMEKYEEVLSSGLLLDHYFLLCRLKNKKTILSTKRVKGFINLLNKKGYLDGEDLTEKAIDLIQNCGDDLEEKVENETRSISEFSTSLYSDCQNLLFELVGKKQMIAKMAGQRKGYSFLPNEVDFNKRLQKVIRLYKLEDLDKIKKTILNHIKKCNEEGHWFPIMHYYIIKDSYSQLVTDYNNDDEEITNVVSSQKFV